MTTCHNFVLGNASSSVSIIIRQWNRENAIRIPLASRFVFLRTGELLSRFWLQRKTQIILYFQRSNTENK